jgi:alpha-tubulin suppressor-like RCC1 family protein
LGWNSSGELGYGHTEVLGDSPATFPTVNGDVDVGGEVVQVSAGTQHTCALLSTGSVRCWGYGYYGALGYGNQQSLGGTPDTIPARNGDVDVGGPVQQVSTGTDRTCALLVSGTVRCWGRGGHTGLGYGNTNSIGDDETPASAGDIDVGGEVVQLAHGRSHVCALLTDGNLRCWGSNNVGQLGYGHRLAVGNDETPASAGNVPVF